jgi:hypothetical protein
MDKPFQKRKYYLDFENDENKAWKILLDFISSKTVLEKGVEELEGSWKRVWVLVKEDD